MILASLLTTTSCQNEEIVSNDVQSSNFSLTVNVGPESRTLIDDNLKCVWGDNEKIFVTSKDGKTSGVLSLTSKSENGTSATFSGFVFGNPADLAYSVYPVPVNGSIDITNIDGANHNAPMAGSISDGSVNFDYACGLVRMQVEGADKLTVSVVPTDTEATYTQIAGGSYSFNPQDGSWSFTQGEPITISIPNNGVVYIPVQAPKTEPMEATLKAVVTLSDGAEHNLEDLPVLVKEDATDMTSIPEIEIDGNGEVEKGAYSIATAEHLQKFADNLEDYNGKTVKLLTDIDLKNSKIKFTPIGTSEQPFTGTFDGNGHTIKNLNIVETEAKEGKAYIGFFGYANNATIQNVTFENVNINIPCLDIDHSQGHIGAVAGSLEGNSTIENVTVKGDIKVEATPTANGASRVAVVAGGNSYGNVTMKNVHVIANEGSYLIANNNTGALAGQLQGKMVFENCSSNIDVTVNKFFAGGLVGIAAGDSYFKNCHTTGDVAVVAGREGRANDHYRVGGIAGGWADGKTKVCTLENCSYTGKVSGKNSDGSVAEILDYWGYVGRGYTLADCEGSKVIIDDTEFVQVGNAAPFGKYTINGYSPIYTADELVSTFQNLKAGDVVYIAHDIDMTGRTLAPVLGNKGFTMLGNGYTISNLHSTSEALFVAKSGSSAYTFDKVVLNNCSVKSSTNYAALFVGDGDTSDAITITSCEVINCTIESVKYAAAFVGYTAGYNKQNDGPVYSDVTITDCSVNGGSITGGGSTGAAIGHAGGNVDTTNTISDLNVDGVSINGEDKEHTGIVVGTANVGKTYINKVSYQNISGNYNTLYGRFVPGTTGELKIDGVSVK